MKKYCRLTRWERYQMDALLRSGLSLRGASRSLGRSPSTLSRELRRGVSGLAPQQQPIYSPLASDEQAVRRRSSKRPRTERIQGKLKLYVEEKTRLDWSPEQIRGRILRQTPRSKAAVVSVATIYRYIYREALYRQGTLYTHLRRGQKRPKKQRQLSLNRLSLRDLPRPSLVSILSRPKIVEKRSRIGDYERDLIRGLENRHFVLTLVDRTTRFTRLAYLHEKTAHATHEATVRLLRDEPVKTLTNDNGSEFYDYRKTSASLQAPVYFAEPYCSWQRGTNENTNGLIRQYLPKKMNFFQVPPEQIKTVETRLNHRPRKCLGYRTPSEVHETLRKRSSVALAV